jgi:4,5-dihydroxyphthalate decarboxylase
LKIAGVAAETTVMPLQPLFNLQMTTHHLRLLRIPHRHLAAAFRLRPSQEYVGHSRSSPRGISASPASIVNKAKGLTKPADLAGRRVGAMVWDMAAAVWLRGIFAEYYDLPVAAPIYVNAGLNERRVPGRIIRSTIRRA